MKKPTPWATAQSEYETRIRQDERLTTLAGLWKHIHLLDKRFVDLAKGLEALKAHIPHAPKMLHPPIPDEAFLEAAPKRKAVTARVEHIDEAYAVLRATKPPYSALSPKNVAAMWNLDVEAYRLAGAALKALVADGRATVKRGKYAQAQQPAQTADGATSEAP